MRALELEEAVSVVVADILNHLTYTVVLSTGERNQTILDVLTNQVAEGTTEVLVTRIAQERTAVGQHTYKQDEEPYT